MNQKHLPGVSMPVTPVCLGTAQFGGAGMGEAEAFRVMDAYVEKGGNFLDTANCYGRWLPGGENRSEQIIGKWMQERGNRSRLVISTKGGHPKFDTMTVSRLSEAEIRSDLEQSLAALRTDCIDLYWLHRDDESIPVGEIVERLEKFRREGKIRAWGGSNWKAARIREAADYAASHGVSGFIGVQNQWSLARVDPERIGDKTLAWMDGELYRLLLERRDSLCTMAFSAMGKGYFSKAAAGTLAEGKLSEYRCALNDRRLAALREVSASRGVSIAALVLAWMSAKPFPAVPIAAVSGLGQLDGLAEAFDLALTPEEVALLDAGEEY